MKTATAVAPLEAPSPWVVQHCAELGAGAEVLDVACGRGRHARWLAARGYRVVAVDRDAAALAELAGLPAIQVCQADLEAAPWPLAERRFKAVVVTRYLHRALMPALLAAVAPGGYLVYETFMRGQEAYGRPRRAEFLLEAGELLQWTQAAGFEVLAYAALTEPATPQPAVLQRICARRPALLAGRSSLAELEMRKDGPSPQPALVGKDSHPQPEGGL